MAPDADYYLEYAAQVEANSPGLAEILRERAAALSGSAPAVMGVPPVTGTVTSQVPTRPMAYRSVVIPSEDRATGPFGRERDVQGDIRQMQEGLTEVERGLVDYYMIQDGMTPDEARAKAQKDIKSEVLSARYNVEGLPEPGGMEGWLPMTRESRIITRRVHDPQTGELKEVDLYYDPDTGDYREPTASEYAVEAFAKQEIMSPEKIGKMMTVLRQQVSDITRQLNYDIGSPEEQAAFDEKYRQVVAETFDDWFMYTDPGTAKTIETFTGAALRSWPAITSTAVNTALMGYLPLFWEQDESGQAVDKDSWAYRIHEALVGAATAAGMSDEEARATLTGGYGLPTPINLYSALGAVFGPESTVAQVGAAIPQPMMPIPFQPVKRTQATTVDPYGQRVASATGNFIVDVFQNLRRGRSMGDEFMSISALADDRADNFYRAREGWKESSEAGKNTIYEYAGTTSPYWYGVGMEMLYGIGPFASIAKLMRSGEKGVDLAAKVMQKDLTSLKKATFVAAHPIEAAARAQTLRVMGDILEGKVNDKMDTFDILTAANDVRRVTGEYGSREMLTPYLMLAYLNAAGKNATKDELEELIGGTESGGFVMRGVNITGDAIGGQAEAIRQNAYRWIASAYKPGVMSIMASSLGDSTKVERIQRLLSEAGANQKVFPTLHKADEMPLNDWVESLLKGAGDAGGALPIQPNKRVLLEIHQLGSDVVRASRTSGTAQLRGHLGRIAQRRLGKKVLGPELLRADLPKVAEAVRAAGGRAIEATIEDVVPDGYVFVTRELMAPRESLTRDVYKEVSKQMNGFDDAFDIATGDKKLDGRPTTSFTVKDGDRDRLRSEMGEVFGEANIRRSPELVRVRKKITEGVALTEDEAAYLRDGFVTKAFRDNLKGRARTAFGGAQAERAMVEGVNIGDVYGKPEARVARRQVASLVTEDIPRVVREGGGRQLMSAVRKALKSLGAEFKEPPPVVYGKRTPLPVQRMIEELRNRVGAISDNFQRELRDAVIDRPKGVTSEQVFDTVIQRRVNKAKATAIADANNEADRLINDVGLGKNEAYHRVVYARAGDAGDTGVGQELGEALTGEINYEKVANEVVQAQAIEDAWRQIIGMYFDSADVKWLTEEVPRLVVKDGVDWVRDFKKPDEFLDISAENVRAVITRAREARPDLAEAGAATNLMGIPTSLSEDAISHVLVAWAVGRDRSRITDQMLATLRARHPEIFVDLVPSKYSNRPELLELEKGLLLRNRDSIYDILIDEGSTDAAEASRMWKAVDDAGMASPRQGGATINARGQRMALTTGEASSTIDNVSSRLYTGMTPMTRKDLVDNVFAEILTGGTVDVSFNNIIGNATKMRAFHVNATKDGLRSAFAELENLRNSPDPNRRMTQDDTVTLALWKRAEQARVRAAWAVAKGEGKDFNTVAKDARSQLIMDLATAVMRNTFDVVVAPAVEEVLANARTMGFTPGVGKGSAANVVKEAATINPYQPSMLLMGDEYIAALEKLKGAARDGRLIENLDMLRQRDRLRKATKGERAARGDSAWEFAKHLILSVVYGSRTLAASGLLAGGYYARGPGRLPVPAPNTRYIGTNLLTAPLLALTTVGAVAAVKAARGVGWGDQARDVARQVSGLVGRKLVDATSARAPDEVVFTTVTGRKWTWAELQNAMDRNNILITRGSLEFQDSWMRDILRDAKLTARGTEAGAFRQFLRNFDPTRTNIFQYIANATDRAFRQNMFASALKEGLTEHQAAQLGRAVVLDYGRLPAGLRSTFNRAFLFVAFRLSMTVELVEALARDASTFNRQLLLMRDSQQASAQHMLGPDYAKARLVFDPTEYVFDGTAGAQNYGPTHPGVDAFFDLAKMGQWAFHAFSEDVPTTQIAAQGIAEENLHPLMTTAIENWVTSTMRETDQGWKVPDVWTAWAVHNGPDSTWPWMKERYNLRAVMRKQDRTPGRPTVRGSTEDAYAEWYFTDVADMRKFKRDLMLATYFGFRRTTEDWTKGMMAFYDSDYIDEKRRGNVPFFPFMTGMMTPIGSKSPEELISKTLFEQRRAAGELKPKLERW